MSHDETEERLQEALQNERPPYPQALRKAGYASTEAQQIDTEAGERIFASRLVQWTRLSQSTFLPAGESTPSLPPAVYEIHHSSSLGIYFEKIPVKMQGLLRFPDAVSDKVIEEIRKFWERELLFRRYRLAYKRGIFLFGPPGSGKSSTVQLLSFDVIERGGSVIKFTSPGLFAEGMRKFRQIQPDTPLVVLMEDLDSIIEDNSETEVLNLLDGIEEIDRTIFLATSNYPENLGARIVNRPSRFDKRFYIGHPSTASRRIYFDSLFQEEERRHWKIEDWVHDTDGFSIAHLKELFIAVIILGDDYPQALKTLRGMSKSVSSGSDGARVGIRSSREVFE